MIMLQHRKSADTLKMRSKTQTNTPFLFFCSAALFKREKLNITQLYSTQLFLLERKFVEKFLITLYRSRIMFLKFAFKLFIQHGRKNYWKKLYSFMKNFV